MSKKLSLVLSLFFLQFLTILQPSPVLACSCMAITDQAGVIASTPVIFTGKVTNVEPEQADPTAAVKTVTFSVSQTWKGSDQATQTVETSGNSAACGFNFEQGKEYVVYAAQNEGQLSTGLCSGTAELAQAESNLAALKTAFPSSTPRPADTASPSPSSAPANEAIDSSYLIYFSVGLAFSVIAIPVALALTSSYYEYQNRRRSS